MIAAQELRIGNHVRSKKHNRDFTVLGISEFNIYQSDADYDERISFENIESIPLTEEWLLRFGFEKESKTNFNKEVKGNFTFYLTLTLDADFKFYLRFTHNNIPFAHNLNYVHQLQNLYFALTGTELKCS